MTGDASSPTTQRPARAWSTYLADAAQTALDDYHTQARARGTDPEAEILAGVLQHEVSTAMWVAAQLAGHQPLTRDATPGLVAITARRAHRGATLLLAHAHPEVAAWLAFTVNDEHDHELLVALARDARPDVRARVPENPSAPTPVLWHLAFDPDRNVRLAAAKAPNLPDSILKRLAADRDPDIARAARATLSLAASIRQAYRT